MMRHACPGLRVTTRHGVVLVTILSALFPCLAAAATAGADREAPVILVPPCRQNPGDESLRLVARVQDASGVGTVTLWARGEQEKSYRSFGMARSGGDEFVAEVPDWPGRGDGVAYYVEATDRLGNGPRRSGDPRSPFLARVNASQPAGFALGPVGPGRALLGAVLLALTLVGFLAIRGRWPRMASGAYDAKRASRNGRPEPGGRLQEADAAGSPEVEREKVEEDLFWFRVLSPLLQLSPEEVSAEIDRLAGFGLRNPVNGMRIYERTRLMDRLEWARQVDPEELRARRKSLAGGARPGSPALREAAANGSPATVAKAEASAKAEAGAVGRSSSGMSFIELLVFMAVFGFAVGMAGIYLRPMEAPLKTATELVEGMFRQARARAMSTTSAHRIRPTSSRTFAVESAGSCSSATWTVAPWLGRELPREVRIVETGWSVCFSTRGLASENLVFTLDHPQLGSQQLEVLLGGMTRRVP